MAVLLTHQHQVDTPMPMGFEPPQQRRVRLVSRSKHGLHFVDQHRGPRLHIEQSGLHVLTGMPERNLLLQHRQINTLEQREPIQVEAIDEHIDAPTRADPLEQAL